MGISNYTVCWYFSAKYHSNRSVCVSYYCSLYCHYVVNYFQLMAVSSQFPYTLIDYSAIKFLQCHKICVFFSILR